MSFSGKGQITPWTTRDELNFLKGLGSHKDTTIANRKKLFERYKNSMESRVRWGAIDVEAVSAYLNLAMRG